MSARPRALYIMGTMGTGKSTFMDEVLLRLGAELGPLTELEEGRNSRGSRIRLRGHLGENLAYIGKRREKHPGQDGLDRASPALLRPWLESGRAPGMIVTEGELFATQGCMGAFAEHTDFLVVLLTAEEWLLDLRFRNRGTAQPWRMVNTLTTRAENGAAMQTARGGAVLRVDSGDPEAWERALHAAVDHLEGDIL